MEDSRVQTWQPEGWLTFNRSAAGSPEVYEKHANCSISSSFLVFLSLVISRGIKMTCLLCQRSDETGETGALSSKDNVVAHQNCLVNIPPKPNKSEVSRLN